MNMNLYPHAYFNNNRHNGDPSYNAKKYNCIK